MLEKTHKLSFLSNTESSKEIEFPPTKRRLLQLNEENKYTFDLPSMDEFNYVINVAKTESIETSKWCKMDLSSYDAYLIESRIKLVDMAVIKDGEDGEDDGSIEDCTNPESNFCTPDKDIEYDLNNLRLVKQIRLDFFPRKRQALPHAVNLEEHIT